MLDQVNEIRRKRSISIDELRLLLTAMDDSLGELLVTAEYDKHGNMTAGNKSMELFNASYEVVENFVSNNPTFDYHKVYLTPAQLFQLSHFYSGDYKASKMTYQERMDKIRAKNYYY
jgi:hypothetical protein